MGKWFIGNDYTTVIPGKSGCYAIYICDYYGSGKMSLVYIGTAQNLYKRLEKHEIIKALRCLTNKIIMIKCKLIDDEKLRLETEKLLIAKLKPLANKSGVYNDKKR